jgi:hypothetical protein
MERSAEKALHKLSVGDRSESLRGRTGVLEFECVVRYDFGHGSTQEEGSTQRRIDAVGTHSTTPLRHVNDREPPKKVVAVAP